MVFVFFIFFNQCLFILLCGEPYGREYMSGENLSMKCAKLLTRNCAAKEMVDYYISSDE